MIENNQVSINDEFSALKKRVTTKAKSFKANYLNYNNNNTNNGNKFPYNIPSVTPVEGSNNNVKGRENFKESKKAL